MMANLQSYLGPKGVDVKLRERFYNKVSGKQIGEIDITVRGDLFPGYYEVCWKLMYGYISETANASTYLRISGSIVSDTLSGGTLYTYKTDAACQIWYSNSNDTIALEANSSDTGYMRYGSADGRYSSMTIKKLN